MASSFAGNRNQLVNMSGGNRAVAMSGLAGLNQQQQNALGETMLKAQDINYGRKQQANQFNSGVEAQNVALKNAAQQANLQISMQEADANARARAAKRNAARQAILQASQDLGNIGRENWASKIGQAIYGYKTGGLGNMTFNK